MSEQSCPCPRKIDALKRTIAQNQRTIAELKGRLRERETMLGELRRLLKQILLEAGEATDKTWGA